MWEYPDGLTVGLVVGSPAGLLERREAMSSGIDVYFTKPNQPWSNDEEDFFRVNVYNPSGSIRTGVPAPEGHASIDLPPGRYMVTGTYGGIYANFDTNENLVNVGCDQRVCVTLIPRSLHSCVWWLYIALKLVRARSELAPAIAEQAGDAIGMLEELEKAIPDEHRMLPFLQEGAEMLREDLEKQ